jgi:hypothetical protein
MVWPRNNVATTLRPSDLVPTTAWTIVMTCGVVSIDLSANHQALLSATMF